MVAKLLRVCLLGSSVIIAFLYIWIKVDGMKQISEEHKKKKTSHFILWRVKPQL